MAARWQLVSPDALSWRELEGELVVRNAQTGSTHLLEPLAGEAFRVLMAAGGQLSVPELVAQLRSPEEPEDEWYAAVESVLEEFRRLGLAEVHTIDRRGAE